MSLGGLFRFGRPFTHPLISFWLPQEMVKTAQSTLAGGGHVFIPSYPSGLLYDIIELLRSVMRGREDGPGHRGNGPQVDPEWCWWSTSVTRRA